MSHGIETQLRRARRVIGVRLLLKLVAGHGGQSVQTRLLQAELVEAFGQVEGSYIAWLVLLRKVLKERAGGGGKR